jgi:Meiotically Up-regulated Gene 113 (MUG113) protein
MGMFVYLIEALGTGLVKIGYSSNPKLRLAGLVGGSAAWLKLVGYFGGTLEDEQELHRQFKELREHHEWFRDDEAIRLAFASHPTWQAQGESASEGLLKLPQETSTRAYPERGGLKQTLLYELAWKTIGKWLNIEPVCKDGVAEIHTATQLSR